MLQLLVLTVAATAAPACPAAGEILARLTQLDLDQGSRKQRFGMGFPQKIRERAAREPGKPFVDRQGTRGFSAIVAPLPVEALWRAVNDEDHHDLQGAYVPVKHSAVVGGTPRGESRVIFQCFHRMGIGRWWRARVNMNGELFARSNGQLWELYWEGAMDGPAPPEVAAEDGVCSGLSPIRSCQGAWLLAPLGESCTFVEHYTSSEARGAVAAFQPLVMSNALRDTLSGIVRLAEEHFTTRHPAPPFLEPDGTPLE